MRRGRPHVLDHDPLERSERRKGLARRFCLVEVPEEAGRRVDEVRRSSVVTAPTLPGRQRGRHGCPARSASPGMPVGVAGSDARLSGTGTGALVRWPKMKAFRSFTVRARLPEPLAPLQELAFNLRWSWDDRTRDVFRWVDPYLWDRTQHDPVQVLSLVARERLEALAKDNAFMSFLGEIHADLRRYMSVHRWFQDRGALP